MPRLPARLELDPAAKYHPLTGWVPRPAPGRFRVHEARLLAVEGRPVRWVR